MPNKKILTCPCVKQGCWRDERNKIPAYCEANIYLDELEKSNKEYPKKDVVDIYKASCVVREHNDGMTPRIEESILYAKELKLRRIGFAACIAMVSELGLLVKLFTKRGFEVYTACCQIGGVDATERGVPEVEGYSASWCHSIAQAEILNKEKTELNFIVGLCMGHDILFSRYSEAPVSMLIVKDRVTGNNPAAALYGWHRRKQLFGAPLTDTEIV
jgi:uncharacterized metal-binding protein